MEKSDGVVAAGVGAGAGAARDPIRIAMYLLPGASRSMDRMVPADSVRLTEYVRGKTPAEGAIQCQAWLPLRLGMLCEWEDGRREIFPYVIHGYSCREWTSLEKAAESLGCTLEEGEPLAENESIGRSVLTGLMCLLDGTVYETKRLGDAMVLFARRWPVMFDAALIV